MNSFVTLQLISILSVLPSSPSYCFWAGQNPSWKGPPKVEQVVVVVVNVFICYCCCYSWRHRLVFSSRILMMINHGERGSGACCHVSLKIFHLTPKIFQLTLTSVRVSWAGLLESQECADSIIVKHYKGDFTSDFFMSDPLDVGTNSYIVRDIVPLQPYTYQVSMIACDITSQNRSCGKSWHSWRCFDHKLINCGNILILYKQTPDQSYF